MVKTTLMLHVSVPARIHTDERWRLSDSGFTTAGTQLRVGSIHDASPYLGTALVHSIVQRFAAESVIVFQLVHLDGAPESEDGDLKKTPQMELVRSTA